MRLLFRQICLIIVPVPAKSLRPFQIIQKICCSPIFRSILHDNLFLFHKRLILKFLDPPVIRFIHELIHRARGVRNVSRIILSRGCHTYKLRQLSADQIPEIPALLIIRLSLKDIRAKS